MSNIISTQNQPSDNVIAARKLKKTSDSKLVQAANVLPKYSLNQQLEENDIFRKNIRLELYTARKKQENKKLAPILKFITATAAILFLTRNTHK